MAPTRREFLEGLSAAALASASLALSGCSTNPKTKSIGKVGLLSPITGQRAQVGQAMERAAQLAASGMLEMRTFDTRGTIDGARDAGRRMGSLRPDIVIGPVSSNEARVVTAPVPILALSNDESLQAVGIYALGVTAAQSTGAVLAYARSAGVRSIAVMRGSTDWGVRCEAAAISSAEANGLRLIARAQVSAGSAMETLRAASGGELPNAVLLPEGGADLARLAAELQAANIQLLGTSQWSTAEVTKPEARGAWIAAPDPRSSSRFAEVYSQQFSEAPGTIAGLAYDAVLAALTVARTGRISNAGLVRSEGFSGVTSMFRFTPDARTERRLSILVASPEGLRPVAQEAMPWA